MGLISALGVKALNFIRSIKAALARSPVRSGDAPGDLREARELVLHNLRAADFCEQSGDRQTALGFIEQALSAMNKWQDCGKPGELRRIWMLMFKKAALLDDLDQYEEALAVLDEMLALQAIRCEAGCPASDYEIARIKGRRSLLFREMALYPQALDEVNEACARVMDEPDGTERPAGKETAVAYYLVIRGMVLHDMCQWEPALDAFGTALCRLREASAACPGNLETQTVAALFISSTMNTLHRSGEAIMHSTYALQLSRENSNKIKVKPELVAGLLYQRALAYQRSKRWKEAIDDIGQARRLENRLG